MELREYLAVRRAYNLVRQRVDTQNRLTFVEFSILCRMAVLNRPMNTSEIAKYQHALRPTMTHRAKHLAELGLIERSVGSADRRNVVCVITDLGISSVEEMANQICLVLRSGPVLARTSASRIIHYIEAMGSLAYMSGDLVELGIVQTAAERCTISSLVAALGLLQPTVSMSVSNLVKAGMVYRTNSKDESGQSGVALTDTGKAHAEQLVSDISALVVHRKSS